MLQVPSSVYTDVYPEADRWAKGGPVDRSKLDWSAGVGPPVILLLT